jgi:hypothetical protein
LATFHNSLKTSSNPVKSASDHASLSCIAHACLGLQETDSHCCKSSSTQHWCSLIIIILQRGLAPSQLIWWTIWDLFIQKLKRYNYIVKASLITNLLPWEAVLSYPT